MICMRFSTLSATSDSHELWGALNILSQPFCYRFEWRVSQQVLGNRFSREIKQVCRIVLTFFVLKHLARFSLSLGHSTVFECYLHIKWALSYKRLEGCHLYLLIGSVGVSSLLL